MRWVRARAYVGACVRHFASKITVRAVYVLHNVVCTVDYGLLRYGICTCIDYMYVVVVVVLERSE